MERTLKLVIGYDGTDFHGWQTQPGVRTVQEELEQVISRAVRHPAQIVGASRTDSGVHARGQTAHLRTTCSIPTRSLRRAIACRLSPDVTVVDVSEVPPDFHATRDAQGKLYRYTMYNTGHHPVEQMATRYAWHMWHTLDFERMRAAAALLVGRHDFAGFANKGSPRETTVRTIDRINIWRRYERVFVDVEGGGFLYNQVRIIVGTLVEIGRGHWPPERITEILASGDRAYAGPTAPPEGLCLEWVRYDMRRSVKHGA